MRLAPSPTSSRSCPTASTPRSRSDALAHRTAPAAPQSAPSAPTHAGVCSRRRRDRRRQASCPGAANRDRAHRHRQGRRLITMAPMRLAESPTSYRELPGLRGAGTGRHARYVLDGLPRVGHLGAQTESSGIVVSFELRSQFNWESYEIIHDDQHRWRIPTRRLARPAFDSGTVPA